MKKRLAGLLLVPVLFVAVLSLYGCGVAQRAQLQSAAIQAKSEIASQCFILAQVSAKEARAWQSAGKEMQRCENGAGSPWPKDKAMEISACGTKELDTKIRPVAYSSKNFQSFMTQRDAENQAYAQGKISWEEKLRRGQERLADYFGKARSGSYLNYATCHNQILSARVFPSYPPQLRPTLTQYMSNLLSFARQADKKKIAPEDFAIGEQQLFSEFAQKEQHVIAGYQAQNAQAWREAGSSILQAEAVRQANQPQMRHTNCHVWRNTMDCTTR